MKYKSCHALEYFGLVFYGHDHRISLCCPLNLPPDAGPGVDNTLPPKETFVALNKLRAEIISDNIKKAISPCSEENAKALFSCEDCFQLRSGDHSVGGDGLIHSVTLGFYPSPCQCKCIYCGIHRDPRNKTIDADSKEKYKKSIEIVKYAIENNLIAPNASWSVSGGEITIHPFKGEIYALTRGRNAMYFTNCFLFDEQIAENLAENPNSSMFLSIDAGTPETWAKVKGVPNFEQVCDNLVKYYSYTTKASQIIFKYIILPDVNDNISDFTEVAKIMEVLETEKMHISRDQLSLEGRESELMPERKIPDSERASYVKKELEGAGMLWAILQKHGRNRINFSTYSQDELNEIYEIAKSLLESGKI